MQAAQSTEDRKVLKVGAALPDPPFELLGKDGPTGFDIDWMKRIARKLGQDWQLVPYKGEDFNGIFVGLADGSCDCIASGTTITPGRQAIVDFCAPYCVSGQSLVVDAGRHPNVHGVDECVSLESVRRSTIAMALFIAEWCGLEPARWAGGPQPAVGIDRPWRTDTMFCA